MPFRLLLECDESRFQVIIAELANSVLPLEVREVRINPETDNTNQGGRRDRKGRQAAPMGGGVASVMHNATVEIFGLAYLVNPPDLNKLKVNDSAGGDAGAAATTNGATGANTGAAATSTTATSGTAAAATATTTTAVAPAANGSGPTTPTAGTSTTTTAGDATKTVPAKAPDATAPSPMATQGNTTGNGAAGSATTPATATPPGNTPAK
jgi:hypothetical protein